MCTIIRHNNVRYEITDILNSLPELEDNRDKRTTNKDNNIKVLISSSNIPSTPNIELIKNKDIVSLQAIINPVSVTVSSHKEVYEYLKKQDLNLLLGLPKLFNCIFHKDLNPSASVYKDQKTSYYWYKCFACDVLNDIVSIVEYILECSHREALRFLRQLYRIEYKETQWQIEQRSNLKGNIELLINLEKLKEVMPMSYSLIWRYIDELLKLHIYMYHHIFTENFTDTHGNPLFFMSYEYLKEIMDCKHNSDIAKHLSLFAYLGLINKLCDEEIPDFLLNEANKHKEKKHHSHRVGFYSIPSYTDEVIKFIELKAQEYKEKGFTIRGFSREMIARALGEEEADRVYPQDKGKQLTLSSDTFLSKIEDTLLKLINHNGYTNERQILQQLSGHKDINKTRLKRVLPEIVLKYGLKREKLNKKLKEKYGITESGYPIIIFKT